MKKQVTGIICGWVIVTSCFALLGLNRLNLNTDDAYRWMDGTLVQEKGWDFSRVHTHWDSFFFLDIVRNGYSYRPAELCNIVFFPLYPGLIWMGTRLLPYNDVAIAWGISCLALLGAGIVMVQLVKRFHPKVDPLTPLLFLLIFPAAFFLNTVYTESLFLFLSVTSIFLARKNSFFWACCFAGLASATRVTGILLIAPLLWEYGVQHGRGGWQHPRVLSFLLCPIGLIGFFLWHGYAFGNPLLFFEVQSLWGRSFTLNMNHFSLDTPTAISNAVVDSAMLVWASVMTIVTAVRVRASYALYALLGLVVPLSTGTMMSIGRYIVVLFPLFIAMATIKSEMKRWGYVFISCLLLSINITLFVNNYWSG